MHSGMLSLYFLCPLCFNCCIAPAADQSYHARIPTLNKAGVFGSSAENTYSLNSKFGPRAHKYRYIFLNVQQLKLHITKTLLLLTCIFSVLMFMDNALEVRCQKVHKTHTEQHQLPRDLHKSCLIFLSGDNFCGVFLCIPQ